MSDDELQRRMMGLKGELTAIYNGTLHSDRHKCYMEGGGSRRKFECYRFARVNTVYIFTCHLTCIHDLGCVLFLLFGVLVALDVTIVSMLWRCLALLPNTCQCHAKKKNQNQR